MLHGGLSMKIFKEWCEDLKNTLIIQAHCVTGSLKNKLLKSTKSLKKIHF